MAARQGMAPFLGNHTKAARTVDTISCATAFKLRTMKAPRNPAVILVTIIVSVTQVQGQIKSEGGGHRQSNLSVRANSKRRHLNVKKNKSLGPVRIGQDCRSLDTPCYPFRPIEFAESITDLTEEVGAAWGKKEGHRTIEAVCAPVKPWLLDMYHVECMEEGLEDEAEFCRPAELYDGIFDHGEFPLMHLPRNFTFKHIRKAGGNSLFNAFAGIEKSHAPQFHVQSMRGWVHHGDQHYARENIDYIESVERQHGRYSLFAVVRDPIERFVSVASEILRDSEKVRNKCGSMETNRNVLNCVLDSAEKGLQNVHLAPMFADMYCGLDGHNIEFSLYNMSSLPSLLAAMGGNPSKRRNKSKNGLSTADLDEGMIKRICRLYAWDVAMMEHIGLDVPGCELK